MRLLWITLLLGCHSNKLIRLENQLMEREISDLRDQLAQCSAQAAPSDYLTQVDMTAVVGFLTKAGHTEIQSVSDTIISIPVQGKNTSFRVNLQLFEREKVLFMVAAGYLELEAATSSSSMVLLLTQLAAMNYELLIGKFQLNPKSGAITLSAELNLDDGLGFRTFESVLGHLIRTADAQHPALMSAAKGLGL
jgi:hypothetical protein